MDAVCSSKTSVHAYESSPHGFTAQSISIDSFKIVCNLSAEIYVKKINVFDFPEWPPAQAYNMHRCFVPWLFLMHKAISTLRHGSA
jgi:hypothetical protein